MGAFFLRLAERRELVADFVHRRRSGPAYWFNLVNT